MAKPETTTNRIDDIITASLSFGYYDKAKGVKPAMNRKCNRSTVNPLEIKNVYFNDPVTVVMWNDGTKTIVRCSENDFYDSEKGLAMAIAKKAYGNDNNFHKIFKKWLPDEDAAETLGIDESFHKIFKKWLPDEDAAETLGIDESFENLRNMLFGKE